MPPRRSLLLFATWFIGTCSAWAVDHYEQYVRNSQDFKPVRQDRETANRAFPGWTFMPWTYKWGIGYDDASGQWSLEHGYNGAFLDHGQTQVAGQDKLAWINKFGLRFYVDHAAGKGLLHLWDGDKVKAHLGELHGTGVRPVPLHQGTEAELQRLLRRNIGYVQSSPMRAAYALDDELSWGHFVHPTMWQVVDDSSLYTKWLAEVYGPEAAPKREQWISYDDLRPKLSTWSIKDFDASPLMDQWSFNDSHWLNLIGRLVEFSNTVDPATPCGIVGGQMPSPFGGYDYAKLMRKVQFIESYDLGSSQAIIRSFDRQNAVPAVTTLFRKSTPDQIWQTWYYLAHGNRGHIGWVDKWFNGRTPEPWHAEVAPTYLEAGKKIGPLMRSAEWLHDGVAIYYSHAAIQLGWILDAEAHGKTWVNRNGDERLSSAAHVRRAWENMLRDSRVQYNFISYAEVIQNGIPAEYRVLILPATLCLSDAEARAIRAFCSRGGTVIADYLPGVWDQHGKGRPNGGVLDDLFRVRHDPGMRAQDVFGERLWVEIDQDANFSWKTYEEFLTHKNTSVKDASGFHKAVRAMPTEQAASFGRGKAVLMNLSPQWYHAYRVAGAAAAAERRVTFMRHVEAAGVTPRVRLVGEPDHLHGSEVTYWKLPTGRTVIFICQNPELRGTSLGGGHAAGLKTGTVPIKIEFTQSVRNLRDERTGEQLEAGGPVQREWKQHEALVLSFDTPS